MKLCPGCKQEKSADQFHRRGNGLRPRCRVCTSVQKKDDYKKHRQSYLDQSKKQYADLQAKFQALKSRPCADCGRSYSPWVMDFDHRPGERKLGNVAVMWHTFGWDRVLAEIAKCDLVCANCHRQRTHDRRQ